MIQRGIIIFAIFLGLVSFLYVKLDVSPVVAQAVMNTKPTQFHWILKQELPHVFQFSQDEIDTNTIQWGQLLFSFITNINFQDARTLFGGEIPAFQAFQYYVLSDQDEPLDYTDHPIESPEPEIIWDHIVEPLPEDPPAEKEDLSIELPASAPKVFIYSSHYWESFLTLPEFVERNITDPDKATHKTKNITLVGKRLGTELEQRGIRPIIQKDYESIEYEKAYDTAGELVQAVMATESKSIDYLIDIHRDSRRKEDTTVVMDGETYASIWIVIGTKGNPNWKQNYEEALKIKKVMDRMYPNLLPRVVTKNSGHGEYNQSISSRSLLFEIGGVDNTLEEAYRSAGALADVLSELLIDGKKVIAD